MSSELIVIEGNYQLNIQNNPVFQPYELQKTSYQIKEVLGSKILA